MNLIQIKDRVRSLVRDFSNSIFRDKDVSNYINEGISRAKQIVPELKDMTELVDNNETPILLPNNYHHLLAVYSASRCFSQDERHYQATNFMNEFEVKMFELKASIEDGIVEITNPDTGEVIKINRTDYVVDNYFF